MKILSRVIPNQPWEKAKFSQRPKRSSKWWLYKIIKDILPSKVEVFEEYTHPSKEFSPSGSPLIFDVYVPGLKLAFEYQAYHHYYDHIMFGEDDSPKVEDEERRKASKSLGITLIELPYWWQRDKETLLSLLQKERPDVNLDTTEAVPFSYGTYSTRDSRGRSFTLLRSMIWSEEQDPTGWWISEKMDGVRAFWDGEKLYSRQQKEVAAPAEFIQMLPKMPLDGELCHPLGYEKMNVIFKQPRQAMSDWKEFTYWVFDAPGHAGTFEKRYSLLQQAQYPNFIKVLKQEKCDGKYFSHVSLYKINSFLHLFCNYCWYYLVAKHFILLGPKHLEYYYNGILRRGGEGVVLRMPESPYATGTMFKLKPRQDTEVKLIKIYPESTGFLCQLPNGDECVVACTWEDFIEPPPDESVLTIKCSGFYSKNGKPKFPTFLRVRHDLTWKDVVMEKGNILFKKK